MMVYLKYPGKSLPIYEVQKDGGGVVGTARKYRATSGSATTWEALTNKGHSIGTSFGTLSQAAAALCHPQTSK